MSSDVVVVGGGVVGCACALALADRGLDVVLLERAGLAAGASGRNRGLLLPHPDPGSELLYREGVAGYRRLAEQGEVPIDLRPTALLVVAADDAGLAEAERLAAALAGFGHAGEMLDPGMLVKLEPCLAPDLAGGYRQDEGWEVDPAAATLAFAAAARRAGAVIHTHDQAHRLLVEGDRVTGVVVDGGPLATGAVVLAAGPWTRPLAARTGIDLPVGGARGWLLQTAPLPWTVGHTLMDAGWAAPRDPAFPGRAPTVEELAGVAPGPEPWTAFALQQGPGGHAVVGGSLAASLREDTEQPETARGLARRALRFVPGLAGVPVVATWSGVRPVTPDGHPLVGPAPGLAGLWVAAGHGPIGVLAAPGTARMLAGHLVDGRPDPAAAPFDPARFTTAAPPRAGTAAG
ncbi:MAG TPA: FAD-binding oxidoreductase [Actinomycetota bacterium]|nr:FAD-binding oxidoreductase [Actinomycetota bacterium]